MSNLPPDWRGEDRYHRADCASHCEYADRDLDEEELGQCLWGHTAHECNCEALDECDAENAAQAWAEWAIDHYPV
jgi:hypothetical protein